MAQLNPKKLTYPAKFERFVWGSSPIADGYIVHHFGGPPRRLDHFPNMEVSINGKFPTMDGLYWKLLSQWMIRGYSLGNLHISWILRSPISCPAGGFATPP